MNMDAHETTATNTSPDIMDQSAQLARWRQYLVPNIPIAFIISLILVVLGNVFDIGEFIGASFLPFFMGFVYIWSLYEVRRQRLERAIIAICVGLAMIAVAATRIASQAYPVTAVVAVWSIVVALPYISGRKLKTLIGVAALSAVATATLSLLIPLDLRAMPTVVGSYLVAVFTPILSSFIFFLLWQYSKRLNETLERLWVTNQALRASEQSLEAKVQERTAELAIARDEASNSQPCQILIFSQYEP